MNLTNKHFILTESLFTGWVLSHTLVNEILQSALLSVSLIAGLIGIYRSLKSKK